MSAFLQCLSHTPLKGYFDPSPEIVKETRDIVGAFANDLRSFDPDLIFVFAPDHYNGFFLDLMPQICIGITATSVGDYQTSAGPLNVPREIAEKCAAHVVEHGFDAAISYRMKVDHGFAQPLEELTQRLDRYPVIPIFINSVAPPVISFKRARMFGEAVGVFAASLNRRVMFIGSGGLSHNPPVPQIATASPEVAERIIAGRNLTPQEVTARQQRTIDAAKRFTSGSAELHLLNPEWDKEFMSRLVDRDWARLDLVTNKEVAEEGGASAHEVKTWIAAVAAMEAATQGNFASEIRYYRAINEWIAGFGALSGRSI